MGVNVARSEAPEHAWASPDAVKRWLAEELAHEVDAMAVLRLTAETLGRYLGATRVAYGEIEPGQDWITVPVDWTDGIASMVGRHPLHRDSGFVREYVRGRTMTVEDVDHLDLTAAERRMMADTHCRSCISVPLIYDGAFVALFSVIDRAPRRWSADEVALVTYVSTLIWKSLRHARATLQVRESEEQFRTLAENIPAMCWLADADGTVLWGNREWADFMGDRVGNSRAIVHPDGFDERHAEWIAARRDGTPIEQRLRMLSPAGDYRTVLSRAVPIRDEQGAVARWCGVQIDLTVQEAAERRQAFGRAFHDRTREMSDASEILTVLSQMLAEHLRINRMNWLEATDDPRVFRLFSADAGVRLTGPAELYRFEPEFEAILASYCRGETLVVNDRDHDAPAAVNPTVREGAVAMDIASGINVPLVRDGRVVAVLAALHATPRHWTRDEIELCEELAQRVCATVTRAQAEAALKERERAQAFLLDWIDRVRVESDPMTILQLTLASLGHHLGVDRVNYIEGSIDSSHFTILAQWDAAGESTAGTTYPAKAIGETILGEYQAGDLVRCTDVATDPRIEDWARSLYVGVKATAFLGMPLVREGVVRAVLVCHDAHARHWRDEEAALLRDIADRVWSMLEKARAEARLRESEALLAAFMENAPLGMHLKDRDGRYVRVNPEFSDAAGVPADAIQGRRADEIFAAPVAERLAAVDARAAAGQPAQAEFDGGDRDRYRSVLSVVFPISGSATVATGGFTIDLTERKAAESALERSRETLYQNEKLSALGGLLAGVSHELNNPLSIVVAQAVMLERQGKGTELADRAAKILKAADRCARIVQTFLAMARQKAPERTAVDLNAVATAALDLAAYGLRTEGVTVERHLAPSLPRLTADADQLHQIVVNLLVNAQQALADAPGERRLTVSTAAEGETLVLEVADTGPGVPESVRRRIFEPFFTTKPQGQGTGVGLSFSMGLAEAHGGRLTLEPSAVGATFRLTLPVDAAAISTSAGTPQNAATPLPARRALVVDDEPEIAEALADFLTIEGFGCDIAIGGAAAQTRLEGGDYDLIVSDLRMPGIDGPALYAWLKQHRPDLAERIAFTTGDTLGSAATRFLAEARRPVLEKPFMPATVQRFLAEVAG